MNEYAPFDVNGDHFGEGFPDLELLPPNADPSFLTEFDMNHNMLMPDGTAPLDLSDFLLSDLDRAEPVNGSVLANGGTAHVNGEGGGDISAVKKQEEAEGVGGGCCCNNERDCCT